MRDDIIRTESVQLSWCSHSRPSKMDFSSSSSWNTDHYKAHVVTVTVEPEPVALLCDGGHLVVIVCGRLSSTLFLVQVETALTAVGGCVEACRRRRWRCSSTWSPCSVDRLTALEDARWSTVLVIVLATWRRRLATFGVTVDGRRSAVIMGRRRLWISVLLADTDDTIL